MAVPVIQPRPEHGGRPAVDDVLILVPGLLCDAIVWDHQVDRLSARHDVRVADLRQSSSIADMAASILDAAPPRFSIAGHSMGARVALEVVRRAPYRVERLALLDTGVHPVQPGEREKREALIDLGRTHGMRALAARWLPPMVAADRLEKDPALRDALFAMVERMTPDIHRNQITALLDRPDAHAALATVRCPVLVGVGSEDRWSPPAQHRAIADALPDARLVVFEGAGHMAPMETPEAVTAALVEWMATPPVSA